LKIDKHVKDLSRRLDTFSGGNNDEDDDDDSYGLYEYDDDYYLDIGSEPPRFGYYRHIRAEKWKALGHKPSEYDHSTTQDELDYALKRKLRVPPEQRYQREKAHWYWHESSWYWRGVNGYDGHGCNDGKCISECRYYHETGRIEDKEVIEEHNKLVKSHRQKNAIVEPPSENELLRLAKKYRLHDWKIDNKKHITL
jgi:hypothetical protein